MDYQEPSHGPKKGLHYRLLCCSFTLLFSLITAFFLSLLGGFFTVLIGNLSVSSPISVPSECKIVSSRVDLRSSKVCELGLLNYKAKYVFYPLQRRKFRCHYDYYWASVFKVEYKEHSSGQTHHALAEAPKEALPLDCRPSFGTTWLTKDKFKVNETYSCWYTPGNSKVDIYSESLFKCQAKDPSMVEMIRRSSIIITQMLHAWFSSKGRAKHVRRDTILGIIIGVLTSFISLCLVKFLQGMKPRQARIRDEGTIHVAVNLARFKRACFLLVYFSVMGWLTIQYGKMLGLSEIFMNF